MPKFIHCLPDNCVLFWSDQLFYQIVFVLNQQYLKKERIAFNLSSFILATLQHPRFDILTNAFNVLFKKW